MASLLGVMSEKAVDVTETLPVFGDDMIVT